jgi:ORF6N domain
MPKPEELAQLVFFVRDEKVMFDADLAKLYGVGTRVLNQALRRNRNRFPEDFAFQLTGKEFDAIRSQIVTASRRNIRALPYAFTEQGVAMLSSVLTFRSHREADRFEVRGERLRLLRREFD